MNEKSYWLRNEITPIAFRISQIKNSNFFEMSKHRILKCFFRFFEIIFFKNRYIELQNSDLLIIY